MRARRKTWALVALLAVLPLAGCATIFPSTSAAIAPTSMEEMGMGLAADIEMWFEQILMLLGAGGL